jgi:biotin transport system substrate-specific component
MLGGSLVMYIFGLSWLAHFVPEGAVLQAGLYPFVIGDLIKIAAAALALPSGWLILRRFKG